MNYSQQDELASLFAQRMSLAHPIIQTAPIIEAQMAQDDKQTPSFVSISAHYTHTTHIRPQEVEPSQSPPPSYHESVVPEAMAQLLIQNSINPSALLPNQIELFRNAGDEQRLRLLELWRISPPSYLPKEEHVYASWAPTTMQQEEQLAKVRFETHMALRAHEAYRDSVQEQPILLAPSDFDTHVDPARMNDLSAAEPYMTNGYQRSCNDPVYAASPALWQSPYAQASARESMEDQYGAMMQIRNHADWEAMNQRIASEQFGHGQDQQMEL